MWILTFFSINQILQGILCVLQATRETEYEKRRVIADDLEETERGEVGQLACCYEAVSY